MPTLTADHAPSSNPTLDALAAEIAAMQVIANALSDIHDREARQRVLSWALERFTAPSPPPQVVYATAPWPLGDDPTLSCEGLEEFFEQPRGVAEMLALQTLDNFPALAQPAAEAPSSRRPLAMLVRGLNNGLELLLTKLQTV